MKQRVLTGTAVLATASLLLAACGGGSDEEDKGGGVAADGSVTLTLAGWSLSSTPEFQVLADAFHEENPDVTVELVEYADGEDYDTQMITDLAAGTAPDLYPIKNLNKFFTYQDGDQLMDVSDVAEGLGEDVDGLDQYQVDGSTYAIPYRQDAWFLYYNKDLFDKADVDYPDGSWTWEDYGNAAEALTENLADTDTPATGAYQHEWQSTVQGFATAQTPDADFTSGDWEYMVPYYERSLALQDEGAQIDYGTQTTNNLTYQAEFGTQDAAMLLMGSWYIATLLAEQDSGDADDFKWGIAPAPQLDESTVDEPITFADPTGIGLNPAIDDDLVEPAKKFLSFIASDEAASALAEIGITPAVNNDTVAESFFNIDGMPTDDLSRFTFSNHDVRPENVVGPNTAALQNILSDAHSAIMSESVSAQEGIDQAMQRAQDEVLGN
ncbi:MAG TPA: extracellular solute-binding protein [Ruania sp.]|nr:extracellular solute-binding protein [Ruania sp.]